MIADLNKTFKNKDLYLEALNHCSWVNENPNKRNSNERLEFLGDAVLELVVTEDLFIKFPLKEEGYLTALRANLVNTKNLARIAKEFELGKELFLSRGERADSDSILADTLEAVIGAIYLDSGLEKASEFIKENILSELSEHLKKPIGKNLEILGHWYPRRNEKVIDKVAIEKWVAKGAQVSPAVTKLLN